MGGPEGLNNNFLSTVRRFVRKKFRSCEKNYNVNVIGLPKIWTLSELWNDYIFSGLSLILYKLTLVAEMWETSKFLLYVLCFCYLFYYMFYCIFIYYMVFFCYIFQNRIIWFKFVWYIYFHYMCEVVVM